MEFVCTDPEATVRGQNVLATLEAFQLMPSFARDLLARHGLAISTLRKNQQVGVQRWLDALREISKQVGDAKLRTVGSRIIENALFPAELVSVESVLLALDDIYRLNHSGRVGRYQSSRLSDGAMRIDCETPYPRAFERGVVEGITRNPSLARGKRYDVRCVDGLVGADRTCTLTVTPL